MKRSLIIVVITCLLCYSCSSSHGGIHSVTYIESRKNFVLGDNAHESYCVIVKDNSQGAVKLLQINKEGIRQPEKVLNSNKTLNVLVNASNALYIENNSERKATFSLSIEKNVNLKMGYQ